MSIDKKQNSERDKSRAVYLRYQQDVFISVTVNDIYSILLCLISTLSGRRSEKVAAETGGVEKGKNNESFILNGTLKRGVCFRFVFVFT